MIVFVSVALLSVKVIKISTYLYSILCFTVIMSPGKNVPMSGQTSHTNVYRVEMLCLYVFFMPIK